MPRIWTEKVLESPEVYLLRVDDNEIKLFEAIWDIPEGITYNAYLLKTKEGWVLFDTWKGSFSERLLRELSRLIDPKEISQIVIHHAEPDHSGALPDVLKANGYKASILCTPICKRLLNAFFGISENIRAIEDGEEIEIGGIKLKFLCVPWLHWPDTMITYLPNEGIIFGCDVGGGYSIPSAIDDENERDIPRYLHYVTKYIVTVIGHYRKYILENFEKLKKLGILDKLRILFPGHGLIWRKDPMRLLEHYAKVAMGEAKENKVLVIYDSMYGFVERAINVALEELKVNGIDPVVYGFTDKDSPAISEVLAHIPDSSALILGFSTYEASLHPIAKYLLHEITNKANYEKPALALGSFGWSGTLRKELEKISKEINIKILDIIEINGSVNKEGEEKIRNAVRRLIQRSS